MTLWFGTERLIDLNGGLAATSNRVNRSTAIRVRHEQDPMWDSEVEVSHMLNHVKSSFARPAQRNWSRWLPHL